MGENPVQHIGKTFLWFGKEYKAMKDACFIVSGTSVPFLGLETSMPLELIRRGRDATAHLDTLRQTASPQPITINSLKSEWKDAFSGLGCYSWEYSIRLRPGATSTARSPYTVMCLKN